MRREACRWLPPSLLSCPPPYLARVFSLFFVCTVAAFVAAFVDRAMARSVARSVAHSVPHTGARVSMWPCIPVSFRSLGDTVSLELEFWNLGTGVTCCVQSATVTVQTARGPESTTVFSRSFSASQPHKRTRFSIDTVPVMTTGSSSPLQAVTQTPWTGASLSRKRQAHRLVCTSSKTNKMHAIYPQLTPPTRTPTTSSLPCHRP
jgi:hypothetical protein